MMGLLFSASGDIFLDLDRSNYFVQGLGSFLMAHIFYTVAFIRESRFDKSRIPLAMGIIILTGIMVSLVFPNLGNMKIPVTGYIFIISLMGVMAAFLKGNSLKVFLGACLFLFSDSIIAVDKFLTPVPYSPFIIMITYYLAQYNITTGMIKHCTTNNTRLY